MALFPSINKTAEQLSEKPVQLAVPILDMISAGRRESQASFGVLCAGTPPAIIGLLVHADGAK